MSEEQWLQERVDVIEDLKLRFRQNQIEQEGNDPAVTGVSFGTPHDLATVHMSSNEVEEKDKGGRPPEGIKYGQHRNEFGWDPTGGKSLKQTITPMNLDRQKTTFQPDPNFKSKLSVTRTENIVKGMKSKPGVSIITESLKSSKITDETRDAGTMLDENNIL
jgi:hypothetical protein